MSDIETRVSWQQGMAFEVERATPSSVQDADERVSTLRSVPVDDSDADAGADAGPDDGFVPDFAFYRYLGHRLEPGLPAKDRRWVIDQVMAIEAPDAVALVTSAMRDLHDPTPRAKRRSSMTGE